MKKEKFMEIIKKGFDASFNYNDVFYTISLIDEKNGVNVYGIGGDNGFQADFDSLEAIPEYMIDDKKIKDIVELLNDDEIFY